MWEWLVWGRDLLIGLGPWAEAAKTLSAILVLFSTLASLPIGVWIRRKFQKDRDHIANLQKQRDAAEEATKELPEKADPNASNANWLQIRDLWLDARKRAEVSILKLHGNARKKYGDLDRYNYQRVAELLLKDQAISSACADGIKRLDALALSKRRSRAATNVELTAARDHYAKIQSELPPSDDESGD